MNARTNLIILTKVTICYCLFKKIYFSLYLSTLALYKQFQISKSENYFPWLKKIRFGWRGRLKKWSKSAGILSLLADVLILHYLAELLVKCSLAAVSLYMKRFMYKIRCYPARFETVTSHHTAMCKHLRE